MISSCLDDRDRSTTAMGQERRIGAVRNISALLPRADVGADIVNRDHLGRAGERNRRKRDTESLLRAAI